MFADSFTTERPEAVENNPIKHLSPQLSPPSTGRGLERNGIKVFRTPFAVFPPSVIPPKQVADCTLFHGPPACDRGRTANRSTTDKSGTRSSFPFFSPGVLRGCKKGRLVEPRNAILGDRQTVSYGRSFASFMEGVDGAFRLSGFISICEDQRSIPSGPLQASALFTGQFS